MLKKTATYVVVVLAALYLILLIPGPAPKTHTGSTQQPFVWNQDARWFELEKRFIDARNARCEKLSSEIASSLDFGELLLDSISQEQVGPESPVLWRLEHDMFDAAVPIAACPEYLPRFRSFIVRLRNTVKEQSEHWDMSSEAAQVTTYRLLYGARAALEEIMLQALPDTLSPLLLCYDEPSATAFARILGVDIHSGDILVSRGGAPTSALIARGNNYQGNFSHVALVYVDPQTNLASIIEAHIERGVTISSLESYLRDKKLRVMVLRLRHDLPALVADPLLPHRVAEAALAEARGRHIPYDFEMDTQDNSRKFCSEVVSDPYSKAGIKLWSKASHISSPGIVSWLSDFGVTHFDTQIPSDLEYDPQLRVVAEWRDLETLYKDHIDNAVIDAMLEGADKGEELTYNILLLPLARVAKSYSWILNRFGAIGPVPEGMSAQAALRNKQFSQRHDKIEVRMVELARSFQVAQGYRPPYWELLRLARQAKAEIDK